MIDKEWIDLRRAAVDELRDLYPNWDGYAAPVIHETALQMADDFIDATFAWGSVLPLARQKTLENLYIYPNLRGTIEFHWALILPRCDVDILIEVGIQSSHLCTVLTIEDDNQKCQTDLQSFLSLVEVIAYIQSLLNELENKHA